MPKKVEASKTKVSKHAIAAAHLAQDHTTNNPTAIFERILALEEAVFNKATKVKVIAATETPKEN